MNWVLLGGLAAAALLVLLFRTLFRRRGKPSRTGYQKRDFLLSSEERLFFATLKQAVGEDYEIFGKIPVQDVISVRTPPNRASDAEADLEAIGDQHFAFVLCRTADLSVACALQLREHSFGGKKSPLSVDPLKSVCYAAGLPFVVIEAGPMYDVNEIREAIAAAVLKEPLYVMESGGRKEPRISGLENLEL